MSGLDNSHSECTCGRNLGMSLVLPSDMSDDERIHNSLDNIFGKSEYIPKTLEHKEHERHVEKEKQMKEIEEKKAYLANHNISTDVTDYKIIQAYEKCHYANMTEKERNEHHKTMAMNYNVIRILFNFGPGLAYPN
jgi:hypothetical protein